MKFTTEITRGAALVHLKGREMAMGEADLGLRHVLSELSTAGIRKVFLDLSRVREIDGACLQEILAWGRRFEDLGGELALVRPAISDLSTMIALLEELRSFPSTDEAFAAGPVERRIRLVAQGARHMLDDLFGRRARVPAGA